MSEHAPAVAIPSEGLAPIAVIGGVLTEDLTYSLYRPLLNDGGEGEVAGKERFIALPKRKLGPPEDMCGWIEDRLENIHEKSGKRLTVTGHSLGGLIATCVGLRRPDLIETVICLAGAQEGVRHETPALLAIKAYIRNRTLTDLVNHDSDFMHQLRRDVATKWPSNVTLHLIATPLDEVIIARGLGLELPNEQAPERRLITPRLPGIDWALRRAPRMPKSVRSLPSTRPVFHCDIPLSGAVRAHTLALRGAYVIAPCQETVPIQPVLEAA